MPEPLDSILTRLSIIVRQPVDFAASDTGTTLAKVRLLSAAASYFNILAITDFGGRGGPVRGEGLVEQAVAAAFQTFDGVDPHPGPFDKAAVLLRGITQGHPFNDGNKRTGFLLACYYLRRIGYVLPQTLQIDEAERLCMRISAGEIRDVALIAEELARLWGRQATTPREE